MADTVFTRALVQAVALQGSTQDLASSLRAPQETLRRWMTGRAMMPVKAFRQLMELLKDTEAHPDLHAPDGTVAIGLGPVSAQCACSGTQFAPKGPAEPLRYGSPLVCAACRRDVTLAELIYEAAQRYACLGKVRKGRAGQVAWPRDAQSDAGQGRVNAPQE